jgi:peptide chain release factor 3
VLQFDYRGRRCNLLDTPGHADFSEDTYRVLAAVDCAVMLVDNAKGVEDRTRKLFEVCRLRGIPVLTLINKCDREGIEPLQLLDDIGTALGIQCAPVNWPVGTGRTFRGVADRETREMMLFKAGKHGTEIVEFERQPLDDANVAEELDLLDGAGEHYDRERFLDGKQTPVFFGSALTNFGVQPFLEAMVEMAPGPRKRPCEGEPREPDDPRFSAFVFKIQANMNPRHRDRVAFMRIQSGKFERGMEVTIHRTGEKLKLAKPHTFLAQERTELEEAWPGDVVGLFDPGELRIGDTLYVGPRIAYQGIPRFAPEYFARVKLKDPLKRKHLVAGLQQLSQEGAIQLFVRPEIGEQDPYLGAVGQLQFEVLLHRLENEYGVKAVLDSSPFRYARWIGGDPKGLAWMKARRDYTVVEDRHGRPVALSESVWPLQYAQRENPGLELYEVEPL